LRRTLAVSAALFLCAACLAHAQDGYELVYQPLYVVDTPTAGLLERASMQVRVYVYGGGGVLTCLNVGVADYLYFGVSYGGGNIIGSGSVEMNPRPEVNARVRIIQETLIVPAVAIGVDTQGLGAYIDSLDRYEQKSRGVYAVASKNWDILGPFSLHGGVNYSFEGRSFDSDPNVFLGFIKTFGPVDIRAEYDFALNDNEAKGADFRPENHGYLNMAIGWNINQNFRIEVDARDILSGELRDVGDDLKQWREWHRGMRIEYRNIF
jgi:hypothetical protein